MGSFNVIALDENYQIVSLLRFTNLQWNRKYHQSGTFSMQLPLEQYSPDIKYIYTKYRPEMGKISQKNYLNQRGYRYIQLSGYFLENELNRHIAYKPGITNILNAPEWIEQSGKAEDVAYAFFNGFKEVSVTGHRSSLGLYVETSLGRGNDAVHTRNGEYLGDKIYDILKPSGMSYRVLYDFIENQKTFSVWSGLDRTEENTEKNNPVIFSTKYGNVKNPNILISDDNYKNACINTNEIFEKEESVFTTRAVFNPKESDQEIAFLALRSAINKNDHSGAEFDAALDNESMNTLENTVRIINLEFEASAGSYEYMKDFDLGDECTIEVPEMHLSANARLIGCHEVIKSGIWSMTMEFGTPIIKGGIYL